MDVLHPVAIGLKTRIETPLFQECLDFYADLIGMTVLESWSEPGDKGAILGLGRADGGEALLELAPAYGVRDYEAMSLQFRVGDMDLAAGRLSGRVEFQGPEKKPWGSTYIYLKDPAGISVILYGATSE